MMISIALNPGRTSWFWFSTSIDIFILLTEKFLQFDWLREEVYFQLNLKYLKFNVKIIVTMVTKIMK